MTVANIFLILFMSQVVWGLEMGHSVLGDFSDLVFVHSNADLDDAYLGYIVGNSSEHDVLRNNYVQNVFETERNGTESPYMK